MQPSRNDLSEKARKLANLTIGENGQKVKEISEVLQEHPELIEAIDEYTDWREKVGKAADQTEQPNSMAHSVKDIAKEIKKKQKE